MIDAGRYTSGRIAVANLSASIDSLELRRAEGATFDNLVALSKLLFVRGDVLGRIADHDRAERIATEAIASSPDAGTALYIRAQLAGRFHRFEEANARLDQALAAGYPRYKIDAERAALLQATGRYEDALVLRERLAKDDPGIHTLGALASLLAEMDRWTAAETSYAAALDADDGVSPFPCSQLLFEWGVSAMRRGDLDRAEAIFVELDAILPAHVPGRGHRAEVALARGQLDVAMTLIMPLLETSDDPEYRAIYAEILAARGDSRAASEAERAAAAYELLLARRPEAYADHAAAFFMGVGNRPQRAVELALANRKIRDTPRSRSLLAKALRNARRVRRCSRGPHERLQYDAGKRNISAQGGACSRSNKVTDVVVIGAGPAGAVAALRAADLGARTALVTSSAFGGMAANDGPVPVRTLAHAARLIRDARQLGQYGIAVGEPVLDYSRLLARVRGVVGEVLAHSSLREQIDSVGVIVHEKAGAARFADPHTIVTDTGLRLQADKIIICVGGVGRRLPIPGFDLTSTHSSALALTEVPPSMLVIGGGATGVQVASIFNALGSRVELFETGPRILSAEDRDVAATVATAFREAGIVVHEDFGAIDSFEKTSAGVRMNFSKNGDTGLRRGCACCRGGGLGGEYQPNSISARRVS